MWCQVRSRREAPMWHQLAVVFDGAATIVHVNGTGVASRDGAILDIPAERAVLGGWAATA